MSKRRSNLAVLGECRASTCLHSYAEHCRHERAVNRIVRRIAQPVRNVKVAENLQQGIPENAIFDVGPDLIEVSVVKFSVADEDVFAGIV